MTLRRGDRVGDYQVEEVLGQGSFGVTYGVRDPALGLRFALKEYFPEGVVERTGDGAVRPWPGREAAFRQGLERFLQEGRTLAALEHPNVARVVRHFEANGTAWLLMTRYDGRSLHDLLVRGGPFDPAEIGALLEPLLGALAYLGERGVVHGDLKPSNVIVQRDGSPVLLDFGAARLAHERSGTGGATAGSAGYAAIEQTVGEGAHGPWTDLYGLSATLYRLVTGEIPPPSEVRWQSVRSGGEDPLLPLGERLRGDGSNIDRGFSRGFVAAVEAGLALEPRRRPRDAAAWRRLVGGDVAADHRAPAPRTPDPERRVWLPQALAGLVLLLLVAGAVWVFLGLGSVPERDAAPPASTLPETSLAEDEDAWEQAVRTDTAAGFRAYLEAFPRGRHARSARDQLALMDEDAWEAARSAGDLAAFEDYLAAFPDGRYVVEARARAEVQRAAEAAAEAERQAARQRDDAAFERARVDGSDGALDAYLADFPGGAHVAEALDLKAANDRERRDRAAWAAALESGERAAFSAYLEAFPQGRFVAEALAAVDRLTLRPGSVFRDCAGCPEMIVVPPGRFEQGAAEGDALARSSERPRRLVRIARPFAIATREVSFAEWERCVAAGACRRQPVDNGWGRGARPVIMVSWGDAQAYAAWLSAETGEVYDLPSESQWEYVARAGETGPWVGGAPERVCDLANVAGAETGFDWRHEACADPFSVGTAASGYFAPNAMGVYDMVGNVAEWTRDCMNLSYLDAPADGSAWERGLCSSRVTRGGSWFSGSAEIRLSARFPLRSGESNDFTGLRVVRAVSE